MIELKEVIVVEGIYDKKRLLNVCKTLIVSTDGFRIFKDKDKLNFLRDMAKKRGLIILTDSDRAGFVIRNYLKGSIDNKYIKNAYIPDIFGKEKRKEKSSREGKIGVEGIDEETLKEVLLNANCTISDSENTDLITKIDLFDKGYIGKNDSKKRRDELTKKLSLPSRISTNALIDALNSILSREDFLNL